MTILTVMNVPTSHAQYFIFGSHTVETVPSDTEILSVNGYSSVTFSKDKMPVAESTATPTAEPETTDRVMLSPFLSVTFSSTRLL